MHERERQQQSSAQCMPCLVSEPYSGKLARSDPSAVFRAAARFLPKLMTPEKAPSARRARTTASVTPAPIPPPAAAERPESDEAAEREPGVTVTVAAARDECSRVSSRSVESRKDRKRTSKRVRCGRSDESNGLAVDAGLRLGPVRAGEHHRVLVGRDGKDCGRVGAREVRRRGVVGRGDERDVGARVEHGLVAVELLNCTHQQARSGMGRCVAA